MPTSPQAPKLFVATKAFITHKGKILVLRESGKYHDGSNMGNYDVVGGRLELGQHFEDSLIREISEETGMRVELGKPFFVNEWRPTVKGEFWQIVGIFFDCPAITSEVKLSQDHDDFKWIEPQNYKNENLIENLFPAFKAYLERNK